MVQSVSSALALPSTTLAGSTLKFCGGGFCLANQSASSRISSRVRSLAIGVICGSLRRPSWKSRSSRYR